MGVLTMINDFFKKLNTETIAGFFLVVKLGFALFLKRWMEHCADALFSALKKYRGLLWLPSLILLVWFPISSVIDACLIAPASKPGHLVVLCRSVYELFSSRGFSHLYETALCRTKGTDLMSLLSLVFSGATTLVQLA